MPPTLLDHFFEFATDPKVTALFSICLGLYILRDIARIVTQLFAALRRPGQRPPKDDTTTPNA